MLVGRELRGLPRSRNPLPFTNAQLKPYHSRRGAVSAAAVAPPTPIPTSGGVVTDEAVPEGHKGLHGFLYGSGGAEEHAGGSTYSVRKGEDDGSVTMPVSEYLRSREGEKPVGVYCIFNQQQQPQYLGYSRNMVLAIKGHLSRVGAQDCASVRAMVFANKAMSSRANLEREAANWLQELGATPPGNAQLKALWEGKQEAVEGPAQLDVEHMTPAERTAYEERKLKLRKAMGEKMLEGPGAPVPEHDHHHDHDHDGEIAEDPAVRRAKLMAAMNRGDWSAVIDAQTKEAIANAEGAGSAGAAAPAVAEPPASASTSGAAGSETAQPGSAGASGNGTIVSPFADGGKAPATANGGGGASSRPRVEMTVAAVQQALEEVRPYLMADGGDVEVVDVDNGVVYLRLQGACSSCPSQSATMKGGIERVIKTTFGDQVRDILQLDAKDPSASVDMVNQHLNMLRGAIHNFGGYVEVLSVEGGVAVLKYKGPAAIGKGVAAAVKDTFRDIREVKLVDG